MKARLLCAALAACLTLTDAFNYTQDEFADGNLMYYTVEGNRKCSTK